MEIIFFKEKIKRVENVDILQSTEITLHGNLVIIDIISLLFRSKTI